MVRTPSTVPAIVARPPDTGVPPITTAVIAVNSKNLPASGTAVAPRAVTTIADIPASKPLMRYTSSSILSVRSPLRNAAWRFPPNDLMDRPKVVPFKMIPTMITTVPAIQTEIGNPRKFRYPMSIIDGGRPEMLFELLNKYAPARAAENMASVAMIGGSENLDINTPFTQPQVAPVASPAAIASHRLQ
jgi:hypothetical protein